MRYSVLSNWGFKANDPIEDTETSSPTLLGENSTGVLTLEVFGQDDFQASMTALHNSLKRIS